MSYLVDDALYCIEYFYAKPEYREELIGALVALIEPTRAEKGCLQYDLLLDKENANLIIMLVKFVDQQTMTAHEQQDYIKFFSDNFLNQYCEKFTWNYGQEVLV